MNRAETTKRFLTYVRQSSSKKLLQIQVHMELPKDAKDLLIYQKTKLHILQNETCFDFEAKDHLKSLLVHFF